MNNEKANQKIQKLEDDILQRFRTRGKRRSQRYPLSPLWPQIWLPNCNAHDSIPDAELRQYDCILQYSGLSESNQGSFRICYKDGHLSIIDIRSERVVLSFSKDRPWISLKFNNLQLTEERGFFHIKPKNTPGYTNI